MMQDLTSLLTSNDYFGRGIIIGHNGQNVICAYFIMGRSENSRNRIFVKQGDDLVIHPFDPSKVADPSLIIYAPIRRREKTYIVTNGDQTDTIYATLAQGRADYFESALNRRTYEPDYPNYTPRISSVIEFDQHPSYKMSILKREGQECLRLFYPYTFEKNQGRFIHTYSGNGNPLPSFDGEPRIVSVYGSAQEFAEQIWDALDKDNRISLCVMTFAECGECLDTVIINKHSK